MRRGRFLAVCGSCLWSVSIAVGLCVSHGQQVDDEMLEVFHRNGAANVKDCLPVSSLTEVL